MTGPIAERIVEQTISSIQPGEHLCAIYENESQVHDLLVNYLAGGLEQGQQVLFAWDDHHPDDVLDMLRAAGVPCDAAIANGQLVFLPARSVYQAKDGFQPDALVEQLQRMVEAALEEGYSGLRGVGEMSTGQGGERNAEDLIRYEALVSRLLRTVPATILCLYDRRRYDPNVLQDVLLAHPRVAVGSYIYENFYYLPPEVLLNQDRSTARLDQWLKNLASRNQMQVQLERAMHNLESLVDETSTDLAQVNAALRESENRYRTIFENAADAIFINDMDGRIMEVNEITCRQTGYARAELVGLSFSEFIPPDQVAFVASRFEHVCCVGRDSFETFYLLRDGRKAPIEVSARCIEFDGRPAVLNIARDITERKRAEKNLSDAYTALRDSEKKFRGLVEQSPVGIAVTDENGLLIEWNACAQEMYGLPPEKVLGRPIWDVRIDTQPLEKRTPEQAAQLRSSVEQFLRTGHAPWLFRPEERDLIRPDGQVRHIQRIRFPIQTERGHMLATIMQDITEQTRAERELERYRQQLEAMVSERTTELQIRSVELRESEERYRALVTQLPIFIMVIQSGRYVFINPSAAARLGYSDPDDLIGHSALETVPADSIELMRARLAHANEGIPNPPMVIPFVDREGKVFYSETSSVPIFYEGRHAALIIGQDVTERVRYEEQLEESLAEKEVMLREIHHRVKNNLNVIIALIDLQKATQTDPQVLQVFKDLQTRAQTMSLVHESLYRSPNLSQVDFSGYLHTLVAYLYSAYGHPGGSADGINVKVLVQDISLRIETAIPCGLIVNELVTNALKYAFPPGFHNREKEIVVTMERICAQGDCSRLLLTVRDNGVGLPAGWDWRTAPTLGLQLIQVLSRQLGAELSLCTDEGLYWYLEFHEHKEKSS